MRVAARYPFVLASLGALTLGPVGVAQEPGPSLTEAVNAVRYRIERAGAGFEAVNPRQNLTVRFRGGKAEFIQESGRLSLSLAGEAPASRSSAQENRVEFQRGGVTEWYLNRADGIEQGFTVAARRGDGPLELALDVAGDYAPQLEHGNVALRRDGKTALRYSGLHSWDAAGRSLPSRAIVNGSRIRLVVDDASAIYPVTVDPLVTQAILTAADGVANDRFGATSAISGDTAIIGAPTDLSRLGQAYVMTRSGGVWTQQAKLVSTDGVPDGFGFSAALEGDTAVVGAPFGNNLNGEVYVFTRTAGQWTQQAKLTAFDGAAADQFGRSVTINGDTIVVGAPENAVAGHDDGAAYIFTRTSGVWSYQAKLNVTVDQLSSNFGHSVSLSGDTLAVGAPGNDALNAKPAVFVFVRVGTLWSQQAKLAGQNLPGVVYSTGASVAVSGDTLMVGTPWCLQPDLLLTTTTCGARQPGLVYVFTRSSLQWTLQTTLQPDDALANDGFGGAVALSGPIAVIGASARDSNTGVVYLYTRDGNTWSEYEINPQAPPNDNDFYGSSVAVSGDTILAGSSGYAGKGGVYVFRYDNVSVSSNPAGRSFTLSGPGCGATGVFATPYSGLWSDCTVQWTTPDFTSSDTRYTFQNWLDSNIQNPREITPSTNPLLAPVSYNGNFLTEYLLTTQATPLSGGSVTGGGWYTAGSTANVNAAANGGFVFTGFTGALTGPTLPRTLPMNGPQTVTGNFTNTPPATLNGIISAKSGAAGSRLWTISLTNAGPGTAFNAQVFVLSFAQTFGTTCTALPIRLTPATLPVSLGNLAPGANPQTQAVIDFSGCPANARFTVNVGYMSNGGASGGLIQLVNQTQ